MPEEEHEKTSGITPEGKGTLRPTVIGLTTRQPSKPRAATVPSTTGQALSPTKIDGTERVRIDVTLTALRKFMPGLDNKVYKRSQDLILTFNIDRAKERKVILWGQSSQESYSACVGTLLTLTQDQTFIKVRRHLDRMVAILGSMDLVAISGHDSGLLKELFRGSNSKVDTPHELQSALIEISQIVALLQSALNDLLRLREELESNSRNIDEVAIEVEAAALAAQFLSDYLRQGNGPVSQRFSERCMSLTQTLAQLRENVLARNLHVGQPLELIGVVQHTALVIVPGFLGTLATIASASNTPKSVSFTEAREHHDRLQSIMDQLKLRGTTQ